MQNTIATPTYRKPYFAAAESQTGRPSVSKKKASDHLPPADRWESLPEEGEKDEKDD